MTSAIYSSAEVAATYIEFHLLFNFYDIFLEPRFTNCKQTMFKQLLKICLTVMLTYVNSIELFSYATLFGGTFVTAFISLIAYRSKFFSMKEDCSLAITFIYYLSVFCLDLLSISALSIIFYEQTGLGLLQTQGFYRLLHLSTVKILCIAIYLTIRRYIAKNSIRPAYMIYIFVLSVLIVVSSVFMNINALWSLNTQNSKYAALYMSSMFVIILFSAFWLAKKFTEISDKQEVMHISQVLSTKQGDEIYNYSQLEKAYSKANHELKNHFLVISDLIQGNKFDECKQYLKSCSKVSAFFYEFKRTGSDIVDIVLKSRLYISHEQGIKLNYKCTDLSAIKVEATDLCSILSNLIDNALDACSGQSVASEKLIIVEIVQQFNFLKIKVSNTVEVSPLIANTDMVTSKPDKRVHGFGLQIVKDCVQKYYGALNYSYDEIEHMFTVGITLCL